jgi:hypothetical protein
VARPLVFLMRRPTSPSYQTALPAA